MYMLAKLISSKPKYFLDLLGISHQISNTLFRFFLVDISEYSAKPNVDNLGIFLVCMLSLDILLTRTVRLLLGKVM